MNDYSVKYEIEYDGIQMDVEVGISEDAGYFEYYDLETGGEEIYAEGGLWFEVTDNEGHMVIDYDGVFELPEFIVNTLKQEGIDTSEI